MELRLVPSRKPATHTVAGSDCAGRQYWMTRFEISFTSSTLLCREE